MCTWYSAFCQVIPLLLASKHSIFCVAPHHQRSVAMWTGFFDDSALCSWCFSRKSIQVCSKKRFDPSRGGLPFQLHNGMCCHLLHRILFSWSVDLHLLPAGCIPCFVCTVWPVGYLYPLTAGLRYWTDVWRKKKQNIVLLVVVKSGRYPLPMYEGHGRRG